MKKSLVVDTNLIFSALLSNSSIIREILLDEAFTFYAPNYIISEIFAHQWKMLKYIKLKESDFFLIFNLIVENIRFTSLDFISLKNRQMAYDFCVDIDIKDTPFVSLALELEIPLWTGDKKLKNGLIKKGFTNFFE